MAKATPYKVNEIFYSLQGEGVATGQPAVFIRFSGCNLKCSFCDTDFNEYRTMTAEENILQVEKILPKRALESPHWPMPIARTTRRPNYPYPRRRATKPRQNFAETERNGERPIRSPRDSDFRESNW